MLRHSARTALFAIFCVAFGCDGEGVDYQALGEGPAVSPTAWPAVALVRTQTGWCTGMLVDPTTVLTAAHCFLSEELRATNTRAAAAVTAALESARPRLQALKPILPFWPFASQSEIDAQAQVILDDVLTEAGRAARSAWLAMPRQVTARGSVYLRAATPSDPQAVRRDYNVVRLHDGFWNSTAGHGVTCSAELRPGDAQTAVRAYTDCLGRLDLAHDFALLTLSEPVRDIHPLRLADPALATAHLRAGASARALGYGTPSGTDDTLHETELSITNVDCVAAGSPCTARVELLASGPHGTCKGDSGGPLVVTVDGMPLVIGVLSGGIRGATGACSNPSQFGRPDSFGDFYKQVWSPPPPEPPRSPGGRISTPTPPPSHNDDDGGCSVAAGGDSPPWLVALAGLLVAARRRRRERLD